MSISDRTDDRQAIRRRSAPDGPPALRRGREHRIVRWISAGNRKAPSPAEETTSAAPDCHVIKLSWADTFGRPDRAALGRSVPGPAQVLPFQSRKAESAPSPGSRRAADQPPVPVLR
ncbi:hypothetical protein [Methylobacterium fujisawaense]|uniref:hypothetical protein n=1 Tax=Methylobacterium fujisawaense TaxID=107400 RepID=UPI0024492745|nr:hypothetical protein [Methylobacterium fujisawaense]MDH3030288.1 hypothetical protein [Methylobacterium fujisawaense]